MENEFHHIIALHESPKMKFEEITEKAPQLTRGWYELSRLSREDRVEFTHDFWFSQLPIVSATLEKKFDTFFEGLEDIGIFLTQEKKDFQYDVYMLFTPKAGPFHFQGSPPADIERIATLVKQFGQFNLPFDYLSFLKIHDGFSRYEDGGLIKTKDMPRVYQQFQNRFDAEILVRPDGKTIDPMQLLPFYEAPQLHVYQCFYADWYPEEEMGNAFFSEETRSISNFLDEKHLEENRAYTSFLAWLAHYLDGTYKQLYGLSR